VLGTILRALHNDSFNQIKDFVYFTEEKTEEKKGLNNLPKVSDLGSCRARMKGRGKRAFPNIFRPKTGSGVVVGCWGDTSEPFP
jgi:hypothetical protein